jgi:TolB-like protein
MNPASFTQNSLDPLAGALEPAERTQLETLRLANACVNDALQQLQRILTSQTFARVQKQARDFLVFIVCKKLLGHSDQIKEPTIAVFVYKEPADYNPAESTRIRVAATSLRRRVALYYATEGLQDPIRIALPATGYVPEIRDRRTLVTVCGFENWNPDGGQGHLCDVIASEIVDRLNQTGWIRATTDQNHGRSAVARIFGVRGSLEMRGEVLRVNVSISEPISGKILDSQSLEDVREHVFGLARQIADRLIRTIQEEVDFRVALPVVKRPAPLRAQAAARRSKRAS